MASYLWLPGKLLRAERNALMLRWACQELCLAYNKKNKSPPPHMTRSRLWVFLCTVLKAVAEDGNELLDLASLGSHLFQV